MTPATVEDAYTMLLEAVEIDDPVVFCEHKYLYNRLKSDALPEAGLPYDVARIARFGRDLTIVAYSAMVHEALAAADQLRKEEIEVEVIDLRCVKPFDLKTVLDSVARTARLLCVGESWPWGGVNSEVITSVVTYGFHLLDAPPQRINSKDTPIPFHPSLWGAHKPSSQAIAAAARRLYEW
jgi:pyruvate dehydrogenase E1 component beta subunit/2-oxoisovalerate dehydrogenase E1 component beta subunit